MPNLDREKVLAQLREDISSASKLWEPAMIGNHAKEQAKIEARRMVYERYIKLIESGRFDLPES